VVHIAIWTVVPTQVVNWGAWRLGKFMSLIRLRWRGRDW
jgi:hypothetical protein